MGSAYKGVDPINSAGGVLAAPHPAAAAAAAVQCVVMQQKLLSDFTPQRSPAIGDWTAASNRRGDDINTIDDVHTHLIQTHQLVAIQL